MAIGAAIGAAIGGLLANTATSALNAREAGLTRDFNAKEAQKNRDWQERMSNTAIQRKMADAKAAGLNPILATMENGADTTGGATASSGVGNPLDISNPFEGAISAASIKKMNAETAKTETETEAIEDVRDLNKSSAEKNRTEIKRIEADREKIGQDILESKQKIENLKKEKNYKELEIEQKKLDLLYYKEDRLIRIEQGYLKNPISTAINTGKEIRTAISGLLGASANAVKAKWKEKTHAINQRKKFLSETSIRKPYK